MLGTRVNDLETRLATQGKLLAEREYENNQLRQASESAERAARELRDEIAATHGGKSPAVEKLRSEKAALEEQLRLARDERGKLQRDINAIQQQAESSWATERMENALLRERINDIAPKWPGLRCSSKAPIRRSRPCCRRNRHLRRRRASPPTTLPALRPAAAARWPNASAPCSRTPRGPARRGHESPPTRKRGVPARLIA